MFLRCTTRKKNGKEHRYWNLVENRRVAGGQVVQRQVLYLGEINDSQREVWRKSIEVFEDGRSAPRTVALFAEEQRAPIDDEQVIQVRLKDLEVRNARQWGGCWLVCELYEQLKLDQFWAERLPPGRKGTRWDLILQTLCIYRFIEPGSEWRLHRYWFDRSAVPELLGSDFRLAESHKLYECHDLLLKHKGALFTHLTERWKDLFNAKFEILLYDLTSTYFECDPPIEEADKRKFGHSRDKRSDCVQVVIALIVTPEGFPLAYEVLAGNTSDKTTLRDFLKKIEAQYGKAERTWVLDRGIPTEEVLAEMRNSEPPIYYLVGTPKGRLSKLEGELIGLPWEQVRPGLDVKLLAHEGELYVQAQSRDRVSKERAMRRRRLRKLWNRLCELQKMKLNTKALLIKIGEGRADRHPGAARRRVLERRGRPAAPRPSPSTSTIDHSQVSTAAHLSSAGPPAMLLLGGNALTERGLRAASRISAATGARLLAETFPARMERGAGVPGVDRLAYLAEQAEARPGRGQPPDPGRARAPVSFFAYPGRAHLVPADCSVTVLADSDQDVETALEALAGQVAA